MKIEDVLSKRSEFVEDVVRLTKGYDTIFLAVVEHSRIGIHCDDHSVVEQSTLETLSETCSGTGYSTPTM